MKKKLLFTAYSLDVGGIETALINLLNFLDYTKYEVTLILEKKEGVFLDLVPKEVSVLEYRVANDNFVLFRKIKNRLKLIRWQLKLKDKFDFSCSFATYSIPGALLALAGSRNNTLWMHGNYYVLYNHDEEKMREFLDTVFVKKFKRLVFVSEENRRDVCRFYEGIKAKSIVCNNFINGSEIISKSKEKIDFKKGKENIFVNVGRHDEHQKKLSRIVEACKDLKSDGYKFKVLFIGDGESTEFYKELVHNYDLNDTILFLGRKKNPFPYYRLSDAVVLSSDYEGYPVVFLEAMVMNKPIISTKVSDYESLDKKYGIFGDFSDEAVYKAMKKFLDNGFQLKEKFDYEKYNVEILSKLEAMFEDSLV